MYSFAVPYVRVFDVSIIEIAIHWQTDQRARGGGDGPVVARAMIPAPLTILLLLPAVVRSTCPPEAEQWGMWQCTWPVATPPANPFDVELLIELRSHPPASRNITVRGFYDGDGMFRARFMPPVVGAWSWRTLCDTVSELHAQVGNLTITAPRQATRNHGPVHAAGHGSTKFAYADGTPWHSVGTTVYGLAGSSWGSTPANTSATLETLRGRGSVFNKVVSYPHKQLQRQTFSSHRLTKRCCNATAENDGVA